MLVNDGQDWDQIAEDYHLHIVEAYYRARLCVMQGEAELSELADDPRIRAVQENSATVLSSPVEMTMGFHQGGWDEQEASTQDALASLSLGAVHERVRGRNVRVAVLDTGVDPTHPHLQGRVELPRGDGYGLPAIETANGLDDDGDGQIDEAYGHGTHVAGIIATVAPSATLVPLRVLNDDGVGDAYTLAYGLYLALWRGVHVVNLSLVLSGDAAVIRTALADLAEHGIVIVGAAGNQPGDPMYPASDPHVVSVAATDLGDVLAPFSASHDVQFAAPGVDISSSFPGERTARATGTSMACAVASGCMALLAEHTSVAGEPRPVKARDVLGRFAVSVVPAGEIDDGRVAPDRALHIERDRSVEPHARAVDEAR